MLSYLFVTVTFFYQTQHLCQVWAKSVIGAASSPALFSHGTHSWKAGSKPTPSTFPRGTFWRVIIYTVYSMIWPSTKQRDTSQAKSACSQVCQRGLSVRPSPRRAIDFPLRHLLSLIFQPEFYWLSKQMIFFFCSGQYVNIKRLVCKQWVSL